MKKRNICGRKQHSVKLIGCVAEGYLDAGGENRLKRDIFSHIQISWLILLIVFKQNVIKCRRKEQKQRWKNF